MANKRRSSSALKRSLDANRWRLNVANLLRTDGTKIKTLRADRRNLQAEMEGLKNDFQAQIKMLEEKLQTAEQEIAMQELNVQMHLREISFCRGRVKDLASMLDCAESENAKQAPKKEKMRRVIDIAKDLARRSNHVGWQTYMKSVDELKSAIAEFEAGENDAE